MFRRPSGGCRAARLDLLALSAAAVLSAVAVRAQEPPAGEPGRAEAGEARRGAERGRRRGPALAVRAGTVHPVSGPAIADGVVLIRGGRIAAVGPASEVEIPAEATVLSYPDGHVYPGFVDALSQAFATEAALDQGVDAGAWLGDALDPTDAASRRLAAHGVTTAYVSNRSDAAWRGKGALIRTAPDGFAPFPERDAAGVHLRLTPGPAPVHPLQLGKQLQGMGREFEQLEAYEKARREHREKLDEYEKKFAEYLDWHRQKSGKPAEGAAQTGAAGATGPAAGAPAAEPRPAGGAEPGGRGGRRGPRGGEGGEARTPPAGGTGPGSAAEPRQPAEAAATKPAGDKAPERPKYPAEPKPDPAKDALLEVRDGSLALFVEVHRELEVDRALELLRSHELRQVVLELATAAAGAAERIAAAGVAVVVDTALPPAVGLRGSPRAALVGEPLDRLSLAVALAEAGVPVALGSGSVDRARHLPSLFAEAVGAGLEPATALRAITLTPAELLGVADRVGSLEPRKIADLVVTSGPLDASDTRVLRVLSAGTTVHEAR